MLAKVIMRFVGGARVPYIAQLGWRWSPFRVSEIRQIYRSASDLRDFASQLQLTPKQARTLLDLAGIDYLWRLHKSYLLGETCSEIARRNGLKLRTLTKLFKDSGIPVTRGPQRRRIPTKALKRIWKKCGSRINRFAIALKVSWPTAKKIHASIYLAPWERSSHASYTDT